MCSGNGGCEVAAAIIMINNFISHNYDYHIIKYFLCSGHFKDGIKGHVFKSVSELVASSSPPRLVRVTGSPHTSPTRTAVNKNDLLLVKKTGKAMLRKPFAKVYSFNTNEEKTINVSGCGQGSGCGHGSGSGCGQGSVRTSV